MDNKKAKSFKNNLILSLMFCFLYFIATSFEMGLFIIEINSNISSGYICCTSACFIFCVCCLIYCFFKSIILLVIYKSSNDKKLGLFYELCYNIVYGELPKQSYDKST